MPAIVDVAPSLGQGVTPLQAGPGASPGYGAIDHRRAWTVGLQEGAIDAGSYKVKQNSDGAAMNVDVDANVGDGLIVQGDDVTSQGRYYVAPHSAKMNITIDPADATNPRLDQIICEVEDDTHDSSALNKGRVRVVKGTPAAGATLDNRSGAAALPSGCMRLADVLVGAGVLSIGTANIRDRRMWARGAYYRIVRNANAAAGNDYTTSLVAAAAIDSTNLNPRIECGGVPVRLTLRGTQSNSGAGNQNLIQMAQDATGLDGGAHGAWNAPAAGYAIGFCLTWDTVPAAGSHQFAPYWWVSGGTATLFARATLPVELTVEEIVRQNTANS